MTDCVFCRLIEEDKEPLLANVLTAVLLDHKPASLGHALIVPRAHRVDISEMRAAELADMMQIAQRLTNFYDEVFQPDGYNLLMNVGRAAGQEVMHAHLHLIPRKQGDKLKLSARKPSFDREDTDRFNDELRKRLA